jgi:E3 ubiquitin-protein ligase UBR4
VKTINIFFTPRPVSDLSILKSEQYAGKWQSCATLELTRGATRASANLAHSVPAANLKVEFTEFYERPGEGTRATDGSLLVHCPRCTRVVTNAHGLCGGCGEAAYQCRKCRHINYDRLDACKCFCWFRIAISFTRFSLTFFAFRSSKSSVLSVATAQMVHFLWKLTQE